MIKSKKVKCVLDKIDNLADFRKRFKFDSIVIKAVTENRECYIKTEKNRTYFDIKIADSKDVVPPNYLD